MRRGLVVVGTSTGGIDAMRTILGALPKGFPAPICVVVHMSPDSPGIIGDIFDRAGPLEAVTVTNLEKLRPGTVYVPVPDHHLIVEPSRARVTRGPRENRFRPAVDPLFRSAAQTFGPGAIGVILTGGLDDGAAGLWAIKRLGGTAVVQDPEDALVDSMPRNALHHVDADHCLPLAGIAPLLVRLVNEDIADMGAPNVPEPIRIEVDIASEKDPLASGVERLGAPSTYACPECHGVLRQVDDGGRVRFRCHTGHAYSLESLIADFDSAIENSLWNSVRALQEKVIFIRNLAVEARRAGDAGLAEELTGCAEEAHRRSESVRAAALESVEPVASVARGQAPARGNGPGGEPSQAGRPDRRT